MLGVTTPVFDTGGNPTPSTLSWWDKFTNWFVYGDTYKSPTVSAPPTPAISNWTVAPENGATAQIIVDNVIAQNAYQNAANFQQTMNDVAASLDKPSLSWGLVSIVALAIVGTMLVKGRR